MKTASPAPAHSRMPGTRHRLGVAVRVLTALVGSYALASLVSVLLALTLPFPRAEAMTAGGMAAFIVFPASAIWSFSASTALRACAGVIASGLVLTAAVWLMRGNL